MNKKVKSTVQKIEEISKKFEIADEIIQASEDIEKISSEIIKTPQLYNPSDVMSLEIMASDFKFSRETLHESIRFARKVLEGATQDILLSEKKEKVDNTLAFAELTTAVLNGIKVHSQLYKDFSNTLLSINKINKLNTPIDNINVTNNLNVTENISTIDLIERLKNKD